MVDSRWLHSSVALYQVRTAVLVHFIFCHDFELDDETHPRRMYVNVWCMVRVHAMILDAVIRMRPAGEGVTHLGENIDFRIHVTTETEKSVPGTSMIRSWYTGVQKPFLRRVVLLHTSVVCFYRTREIHATSIFYRSCIFFHGECMILFCHYTRCLPCKTYICTYLLCVCRQESAMVQQDTTVVMWTV